MVSDQNLSTDVWTAIRTLLVAGTIQTTNTTTEETTNASILATYNDKKTNSPQVIINPIETDEALNKFGGSEGKKVINVIIDCYAHNGLGADQLADDVKYILKGNEISGIELIAVTTNINFDTSNERKFHLKSLTFTYQRE